MDVMKIEVMTGAGLISFHVADNEEGEYWKAYEGKMIFEKLSGRNISFVESNVIYINEIKVADNSGGDSVE